MDSTMIGKNRFDEPIRNGERNRDAIPLIANWCANAKIRAESYGLLAQETQLPIGHHSIECDYATDDSRSSFYELRDAAVDYYDRNCAGCSNRKGGRLPNLMELVAARDREQEQRIGESQRATGAAAVALATRDEERRELKSRVSPIGQALVDDIGAFDRDASRENLDRLMRSAEMAPEHFSEPLIDYIFGVCETAHWLDAPGLQMLAATSADPARLAAVAARVMARGRHRELAAKTLEPLVEHLDEDSACAATPGAMDIAKPARRMLGGAERAAQPALLNALYEYHSGAVGKAVERLLTSRSAHSAELAGRGLRALLSTHPRAATPHARTLIATYVRAERVLDDFDDFDDPGNKLNDLAGAVVGAFDADPAGTDKLLQAYLEGASEQVRARVYELYGRALQRRGEQALPRGSERVRIAFRQLLWATTGEFNAELMQTAIEVFRDGGGALEEVAKLEIEALLSAPFLLADRLRFLEDAPLDASRPLAAIERQNHRSAIMAVLKGLLELVARAALQDRALMPQISQFLKAIPEDRQILRGIAIEEFARLASDVAGLEFYLPHLYRAMVGPSTIERSYAATAVGDLGQSSLDNAPHLVFEAFELLLRDAHVMVHKAAARAFRRSLIPEPYRRKALGAIYDLVSVYRTESREDHFVAECVRTLAASADDFGKQAGALRRYLVDVCMGVDPDFLRSHMRGLSLTLGSDPTFIKLVVRMLPAMIDRYNRNDAAENLVRELSSSSIRAYESEFEALGIQLAASEQWLTLVVIDALARAGAGEAAARVAKARVEALQDIPRNRSIRLFARLVALTFEFENALAIGGDGALQDVTTEWEQIEAALKKQREEQRERDRRNRLSVPG